MEICITTISLKSHEEILKRLVYKISLISKYYIYIIVKITRNSLTIYLSNIQYIEIFPLTAIKGLVINSIEETAGLFLIRLV